MPTNKDPLFQSGKQFLKTQATPAAKPAGMPIGESSQPSEDGINYADVANGEGNHAWSQYANIADVKGPASLKAQQITSLSDEQLMEAIKAPLSGEEVAMKMAAIQSAGGRIDASTISKEEFEAYDPWREKQHFNFMGAVAEGALGAVKDIGKGVYSAGTDWKKLGLAVGLSAVSSPVVGFGVAYGSSLLEGAARGTRDLGGLAVMAANHPGSPLYRMFVNPTNDMNKKYEDFLDLAKWNADSEDIISGKSNALMPSKETYEKLFGRAFGNQVDEFIGVNKELATAASYFLDPTTLLMFAPANIGEKIFGKVASAAIKSGEAGNALGHAMTARAARNAFKASWLNSLGENMVKFSEAATKPIDAMFDSITRNAEAVTGARSSISHGGTVRVSRVGAGHGGTKGPTSVVHAGMGALGMYSLFHIPYALPITSVYAGLKGVGMIGETILDIGGKGLEHSSTVMGKAIKASLPITMYMQDLAKTAIHGGVYGGLIGYAASGEEGAAGGIGTGAALGAIGHNVGYAYGTFSGQFAKEALYKEFDNHFNDLKEKGHILKHDRVREFIDRIRDDHGDEEAIRAMSHVMALEKSKNTAVAYMGYKDFLGALANDPKMWESVIGENGPERKLSPTGEVLHSAMRGVVEMDEHGNVLRNDNGDPILLGRRERVESVRTDKNFVGPMPEQEGGVVNPNQAAWNGLFLGKDGKSSPIKIFTDGETGRNHIIINTDMMVGVRDKYGNPVYDTAFREGRRANMDKSQDIRVQETTEGPRVRREELRKKPWLLEPEGLDEYGMPLRSKKERTVAYPDDSVIGPMPPETKMVSRKSAGDIGPMPAVEVITGRKMVQAKTAPLGELWHAMNNAYRKINHGQEITNSVRDWLIGSGGKAGRAFSDRKQTVQFMHDVYRAIGGASRDGETGYNGAWRKAIHEFEQTGEVKSPEVQRAFRDFIEELGESMFIGWESGKPFDYVYRGGDLGFARNLVESVKDSFFNRSLREATNLGADIRSRDFFINWFKEAKDGRKFRMDPILESSFNDLIRCYRDNEMKDAGLGRTDLNTLTSAQLKRQAEIYGFEDRIEMDEKGNYKLKSDEKYNAEQFAKAQEMGMEMAHTFQTNPDLFNGVDVQVVTNGDARVGTVEANFVALDAASRDPNTSTADTLAQRRGAFLFQNKDFADVGAGIDEMLTAQAEQVYTSGVYAPRTKGSFGARGRPRTTPTGKLQADLLEAMKTGKKLILRGVPNEALFAIIQKHVPKSVSDNIRLLAPLIIDGGISVDNVARGQYHGFTQVDKDGVKRNRKTGDSFNAREVTFVPYNLELSWTLDNIKNPEINYERAHLAYNVQSMDIDAFNRRMHILWNESPELQALYGDIQQFIDHTYRTVDEYSASKEIPAVDFFGEGENARQKRKYVVAAIGASPNIAHHMAYSLAEAEWHAYQYHDRKQQQNHPWQRFRLDGLTGLQSIDGERARVRINETQYYRSMVPTPTSEGGSMWVDSTGKSVMYQPADGTTPDLSKVPNMSPQKLGRRYDMNSEQWKTGFIGRAAEEQPTWVDKGTPMGKIETLKDKVIEFKINPNAGTVTLEIMTKKGGESVSHVYAEASKDGKHISHVAVTTMPSWRRRGYGDVAYSELIERVRAMDFKAFDGEIINSEGLPMRLRNNRFGHGGTFIVGPDWTTIVDKATQAEVVRRLDNDIDLGSEHQGVRVSSPIIGSAFYQTAEIGDGPIPINMETMKDFNQSTTDKPYNADAVAKRLNDPLALVKELNKQKEFRPNKSKPLFQPADTFGARSQQEADFLRSNYKWSEEEKGDIFLSEAMIRFGRQFYNGKEMPTIIKYALEEWLKTGGNMDVYNAQFVTGRPVVVVGTHGTQSVELIKSQQFRGEMLGGNTGAKSAERGHFHAGRQDTSYTYGKIEGATGILLTNIAQIYRELKSIPHDKTAGVVENKIKDMRSMFDEAMLLARDSINTENKEIHRYHMTETERLIKDVSKDVGLQYDRTKQLNKVWAEIARIVETDYPKVEMIDSVSTAGKSYQYPVASETGRLASSLRNIYGWNMDVAVELLSRLPSSLKNEIASIIDKKFAEPNSRKLLKEFQDGESALKTLQADAESAYTKAMSGLRNFREKDFTTQQLRSAIGFKNPFVYDFKGSFYREIKYDTVIQQAASAGHDGVIMLNTFDGGHEIDNIYVTLKGNEGTHIAVIDSSLTGKAKKRGLGGQEGGRWLQQPSDDVLPAGAFGPNNPDTVRLARAFKTTTGLATGDGRFVIKLNPNKSFKIGREYDILKHDPYNPKVRAAYKAFGDETLVQMQHIIDAGYKPEMHGLNSEPYSRSADAIADIRNNKRLKVLSTDKAYGTSAVSAKDITENPLLAMSKFKDANGVPMRVLDVFRFVHDFFGHSERGNGFGQLGEENAWDVHARMYSPLARRAMTTSTRGQNSWVNFIHEPNMEINRKRDMVRGLIRDGRVAEAMEIQKTIGSIRFADQKIGLMPEWVSRLDEELTPIERQVYGTHATSEKTFGLYQNADGDAHSIHSPEAEEFARIGKESQAASKFGTAVDMKSADGYKGHTLLMSGEGRAQASISPSGELGSVIKGVSGTASDVEAVVKAALSTGKVRWLNAFDTVLPSMYDKFGFEAVARLKFVDDYRPDGWDYVKYAKFNSGRPDVVFMAYVGEGRATPYERNARRIPTLLSYDDAVTLTQEKAQHARDNGYLMQPADMGGPDPVKFENLRKETKEALEFRNAIFDYAEFVRMTDERIKASQEPMNRGQILSTWFKKNVNRTGGGQSPLTWNYVVDAEGKRIPIEEFTREQLDELKDSIARKDPNFKKVYSEWEKTVGELYTTEADRLTAQLRADIEAEQAQHTNQILAGETGTQRGKRLARDKYLAKVLDAITNKNSKHRIRSMESIFKTNKKAEANRKRLATETDRIRRRSQELRDIVELEMLNRDESENAGKSDQELKLEIIHEAEIRLAEEESKRTEKEYEELGLEDENLAGEGDLKEAEGLSKDDYRKLAQSRAERLQKIGVTEDVNIDDVNAEVLSNFARDENSVTSEDTILEYKSFTADEIEKLMRLENNEAFDKDGAKLWSELPEEGSTTSEFDYELQKRIRINNQLIDIKKQTELGIAQGTVNRNQGTTYKVGSLQYLSRYKYANSIWFNSTGEPILREIHDGKIVTKIEGIIDRSMPDSEITITVGNEPPIKRKFRDLPENVKVELLDDNEKTTRVKVIVPPEYQAVIDSKQALLSKLRNADTRLNTPLEHLEPLFGLFALWGFEVNEALKSPDFVAGHTEGAIPLNASGAETLRAVLSQTGVLFTGFDRPASFTTSLKELPDLMTTTMDVLADMREGAYHSMKDKTGKKDRRGNTATAVSDIRLDKQKQAVIDPNTFEKVGESLQEHPLIVEWLDSFLINNPQESHLVATLATADTITPLPEKELKAKIENRYDGSSGAKKKFKKENGRNPNTEEAKAIREKLKQKILLEHSLVQLTGRPEFVGSFFDNSRGKKNVNYGDRPSVEYRAYLELKKQNDAIVARKGKGKGFGDQKLKDDARQIASDIRYQFIEYMFTQMNSYINEQANIFQESQGLIPKDYKTIQAERRNQANYRADTRNKAVADAHESEAANLSSTQEGTGGMGRPASEDVSTTTREFTTEEVSATKEAEVEIKRTWREQADAKGTFQDSEGKGKIVVFEKNVGIKGDKTAYKVYIGDRMVGGAVGLDEAQKLFETQLAKFEAEGGIANEAQAEVAIEQPTQATPIAQTPATHPLGEGYLAMMRAAEGEDQGAFEAILAGKKDVPVKPVAETKPVAKPVEPKPTAEAETKPVAKPVAQPAPYKQNTTATPLPFAEYDAFIGPRQPPLALPAPKPVAKPVTPTVKPKPKPATPAVEAVKTQNATAQVKKIVQTQVAQAQVKPVNQVGASQVVLQTQGPLAASTRENLAHTQSVLGIKDHLTLKMNGTRISTADKRYIVTGKAGKYDVVMQAHASPYTGQILDQRVVAIVPTLEHAQLCIREFDNLQRSLAELEGVNTSANLQASAPVMAPQQIAQVATQLAQANAQNPVPPVTSPKTQAEVHPQFNACVVGLSKLRIPQALAKELVTNAVNALGSKAGVAEIVAHALHANQVTAAQIAHANQVFVATANQTTSQPNPNGIHQVVVLPSLAGLNAACGAVVPRPPTIAGLGGPPNSIPSPVQNATKPIWVPTAESLERFNRLIRFNRYSNKVKLPNGAEGIGTTLVNDLGYTIMQTSPSKFRLFAPNKMLISVADNEQQACDDLLKHHFKK
jgi:hypothetical protein